MHISISRAQPSETFRWAAFACNDNIVVVLSRLSILVFCHVCATGNVANADIAMTHKMDKLVRVGTVKKIVSDDQVKHASTFSTSSEVSTTFPNETSVTNAVVGVASWYNPYLESNNTETASGQFYDPDKWTAAIQIDLRDLFGGVAYGKAYRPVYALIETGDKRVIVEINDVGPLKPGRVIDLNERTMRYFDENLQGGLLANVTVTQLAGENWTPGPVASDQIRMQWCGPELQDAHQGAPI
jgi:rare lipoprotein A